MPEHVPAGRAGRLWLIERLDAARRGIDLLDRKHQLLRREYDQLRLLVGERRRALTVADAAAQRWGLRAAMLGGAGEIALVAGAVADRARVSVSWQNTMGVIHPERASCTFPEPAAAELAATNSAVGPAAAAYRHALQLAAELAVAETARDRVEAELHATQRRLRAIRRHRAPALADALQRLELQLDELEREDRVATRWAQQRRESG